MITVKVKLFASLRGHCAENTAQSPLSVTLPEQSSVAQLLDRLGLDTAKIIFVNGAPQTDRHAILRDADEIALFPLLAGG